MVPVCSGVAVLYIHTFLFITPAQLVWRVKVFSIKDPENVVS